MRLKGRQARFLTAILCLWSGLRIIQLWPMRERLPDQATAIPVDDPPAGGIGGVAPAAIFEPWIVRDPRMEQAAERPRTMAIAGSNGTGSDDATAMLLLATLGSGNQLAPHVALHRAMFASEGEVDDHPDLPHHADAAPVPPFASMPPVVPSAIAHAPGAGGRRLAVEAYLFVRPGSGSAALSPAGQLGGSQAAARATFRLGRLGPVAIAAAARVYAPLRTKGAEAAAGLDLRPVGSLPLRLSIERRQRLDQAGRSAWSAYAAGGFYREDQRRRIVVDGYAQAGIVGLQRRDLFVDGAVRAGWRVGTGAAGPIVGAGVWGAAQPGVARIDVGPRAAVRLPIADHGVSLAVEGRFHIAGDARPGSGVALTIAADL